MANKKTKICIVIPIYKPKPDDLDKIALSSLQNICGDKYDKYFICPDGLNVDEYQDSINLKDIVFFDKKYFESNVTYSQLLIQYDFYATFKAYDYMLIYQTDCYMFRDEVDVFADMGYDYIGAPILSKQSYWPHFNGSNTPICGNGGLSLRKIQTFMDICDPEGEIYKEYNKEKNRFDEVWCEDRFFCDELSAVFELDKPHWKIAAQFAFDFNPDLLIEVYHFNIPMGCHAYDKNIRFWKKYVPELADEHIVEMCEKRHEKYLKNYYLENGKTYAFN